MADIPIHLPRLNRRAWFFAAGALALLGVVAGALPWLGGAYAEDAVRAALARGPAGFRATLTRYERGWFHTDAQTTIRHAWLPIELHGTHRIHHGPFVLGGVQHRFLAPVAALIESDFLGVPGLRGEATISLAGAMRAQLALPGQLAVRLEADTAWETLRITVEIARLELPGPLPGSALAARAMTLHADWRESGARAYIGDTTVTIADLALSVGALPTRLQGVDIQVRSTEEGELLSAGIAGSVRALHAGELALGSAEFTAQLRNWDPAAARRTENELAGLVGRNLSPARRQEAVLEELARFVGALARRRVALEVQEFSLRRASGALKAEGKASVLGIANSARPTPARLLRALRAEATIRTTTAWLKPILAPLVLADLQAYGNSRTLTIEETAQLTPEIMERIVAEALPLYLSRNSFTRWLRPNDNSYTARFALRDGRLLINGASPY